jgi:hypothetical protein
VRRGSPAGSLLRRQHRPCVWEERRIFAVDGLRVVLDSGDGRGNNNE